MKSLRRVQFGNPLLREAAKQLGREEILSSEIQELIKDMFYTLEHKKLGVGLAAPQVGKSVALFVLKIQTTKHRPEVEPFEAVLINPEITEKYGRRKAMWEGCISGGSGNAGLFAKVPRYKEVKIKYSDEKGTSHHKKLTGLPAHVAQHEVDHLNGILFVDRVRNTKSYTTYSEYMKRVKTKKLVT